MDHVRWTSCCLTEARAGEGEGAPGSGTHRARGREERDGWWAVSWAPAAPPVQDGGLLRVLGVGEEPGCRPAPRTEGRGHPWAERGWPGRSWLTAGALVPALSCPCVFGPLCLGFPSIRQDGLAVQGLRGASCEMACVERSELVHPPPSSSGQREEASPRLAAKQGHGEAPLPPTLLGPCLAGQAPGWWGSCGSGQPLLARLPHPQGKAGLSPWGTPPADRRRTVPASPDQSGHRTLQFAWKGSESAALVCPPHFTVYPFP